ncbi:MAG: hypothetical protein ACRCWQ_12320, partial [Bacilli bacterium]
ISIILCFLLVFVPQNSNAKSIIDEKLEQSNISNVLMTPLSNIVSINGNQLRTEDKTYTIPSHLKAFFSAKELFKKATIKLSYTEDLVIEKILVLEIKGEKFTSPLEQKVWQVLDPKQPVSIDVLVLSGDYIEIKNLYVVSKLIVRGVKTNIKLTNVVCKGTTYVGDIDYAQMGEEFIRNKSSMISVIAVDSRLSSVHVLAPNSRWTTMKNSEILKSTFSENVRVTVDASSRMTDLFVTNNAKNVSLVGAFRNVQVKAIEPALLTLDGSIFRLSLKSKVEIRHSNESYILNYG